MTQLAEINVARLLHPLEDPRVAPFVAAIDRINRLAERSDGFVWRNAEETSGPIGGDPQMIATVSVWASPIQFERFVFGTLHRQFYERRAEWFGILDSMHFAMWWVADKTHPSLSDALARLAHLNAHGDSDHAFGWDHLAADQRWHKTPSPVQGAST
ncbi:DUF3291 domain-containing protein [Cognatishimia sp. F0-27]|uniref:DUF3291 domain-containing protein n=1 Tax=Cognatishimia sp. F0-27 TaxID=2816855 RepID=UPI001D0C1E39|nr:DUF3291 domain-containing protein [Cognatishimia sp. F0-27]MCC1492613.1 DUF3291 domain-containing protein [Cognatishimia sp. F0-27]